MAQRSGLSGYAASGHGCDDVDFSGASGRFQRLADYHFQRVKTEIFEDTNDFKAATELLKKAEDKKEYILVTGEHSAVVRKAEKGFEFLELQSPVDKENGFQPITKSTLRKRFGCKKTHTAYGTKISASSLLIDVESLGNSDEFKDIMSYINTPVEKQLKGAQGSVK